jgi:hypothetical protein
VSLYGSSTRVFLAHGVHSQFALVPENPSWEYYNAGWWLVTPLTALARRGAEAGRQALEDANAVSVCIDVITAQDDWITGMGRDEQIKWKEDRDFSGFIGQLRMLCGKLRT